MTFLLIIFIFLTHQFNFSSNAKNIYCSSTMHRFLKNFVIMQCQKLPWNQLIHFCVQRNSPSDHILYLFNPINSFVPFSFILLFFSHLCRYVLSGRFLSFLIFCSMLCIPSIFLFLMKYLIQSRILYHIRSTLLVRNIWQQWRETSRSATCKPALNIVEVQ